MGISIIINGIAQRSSQLVGLGEYQTLSAREDGAEGVKVSEESCSPAMESYTTQEKSVHQLEQLLATMRVNLEKSKLQEARVGTVVPDAI